jgi:hypothetical protein
VTRAPEDALAFVDLSKHAAFFDDLAQLFEAPVLRAASQAKAARFAPAVRTLKVHKVGAFVASFVPQDPAVTQPAAPDAPWAGGQGASVSMLTPGLDYEGVVARGQPVLRRELRGRMANEDTYVALDAGR